MPHSLKNNCGLTVTQDVRFGSQAALQSHSSSTAASGCKAAVREADFQNANLNDCFTQQRPSRAAENHDNEGQLTADTVEKLRYSETTKRH